MEGKDKIYIHEVHCDYSNLVHTHIKVCVYVSFFMCACVCVCVLYMYIYVQTMFIPNTISAALAFVYMYPVLSFNRSLQFTVCASSVLLTFKVRLVPSRLYVWLWQGKIVLPSEISCSQFDELCDDLHNTDTEGCRGVYPNMGLLPGVTI